MIRALGLPAISSPLFLQGARLSRDAVINGATHWHLHIFIASTSFVMFLLIGLSLSIAFPTLLPSPKAI